MACKHGHWQVMTLNKLKRCSSALSSSEDNDYGSMPASPEPALAPTPKHRWAGGALSRAASNWSDQMPRRRNSARFVGRLSHHCHYHTCLLSAPVACVTLHSSFFCCARRLLGHACTDAVTHACRTDAVTHACQQAHTDAVTHACQQAHTEAHMRLHPKP